MRRTRTAAAAALIALTGLVGTAFAQLAPSYEQSHPYDRTRPPALASAQSLQRGDAELRRAELSRREDQFRREEEMKRDQHPRRASAAAAAAAHHRWKTGDRMSRTAWNQQKPVDWRNHQLEPPARGYEWRQVDTDYVLARSATRRVKLVIHAAH